MEIAIGPLRAAPGALDDRIVHVWFLDVGPDMEPLDPFQSLLSPDEQARAARFIPASSRRQFVITRATLRCLLARYLGTNPTELQFQANEWGKPQVTGPPAFTALRFNAAHSADRAALAFTRQGEIGIDLERIRPSIDLEGIARRFFAPAEAEALSRHAPKEKPDAFFAGWTRKEAFIKARGQGLSLPLDQFVVSLDPTLESTVLLAVEGDAATAAAWTLVSLPVTDGYAAALAVEGRDLEIRCADVLAEEPRDTLPFLKRWPIVRP